MIKPLYLFDAFVVLVMLSIGLRVRGSELMDVVRGRSILIRTLVANCVLIPAIGFLTRDAMVGLLLLAAIPGTPIAMQFTSRVERRRLAFASGMTAVLSLVSIVMTPLAVEIFPPYPSMPVKEIRARAGADFGGVNLGGQSPLTLVLPVKSPNHLATLSESLSQRLAELHAALDTIGTVYFFRFVPLGTHALALVGEHDGELAKLAEDFWMHLGPMFDEIFQNVLDSPPTPVRENRLAFTHWMIRHNLKTWGLYSAYPSLSAQNIRVLAGSWF